MRPIKIFTIAAFLLLLIAPAIAQLYKPANLKKLKGVTQRQQPTNFAWVNITNGSWQNQIEQLLTRRSSIFPMLVKAGNQMNLELFNQLSGNYDAQVVLGNNNCLIEGAYIRDANALDRVRPQRLHQLANDLAELEQRLKSYGIQFLLLISPNKVVLYPECLPPEWRVSGYAQRSRDYTVMKPLLERSGISYFDTTEFFRQKKSQVPYRFFSDAGTHWNRYAACLVTAEITARFSSRESRSTSRIDCNPPRWPTRPKDSDVDIANIANLWSIERFMTPVPKAQDRIIQPAHSEKPNLLVVGSSFTWTILNYFKRHKIFDHIDFWYYFERETSWPVNRKKPLNLGSFDWHSRLLNRDIVIIEINESVLEKTGFGFVEAALSFLRTEAPLHSSSK